ncbi:MAG: superoxide dismutase [Clostridiales bacterium]|nr:superoxide dismutase [Clostridiales bacterium]
MIQKFDFIYTDDITVINEEQFDTHIRLYEGYINKFNEIQEVFESGDTERDEANATYSKFRCLKQGRNYSLNGVILHELYFENLGGSLSEPTARTAGLISQYYGCVSNWMEDFIGTAKASRGWTVMAFEQRTGRLMNISLDSHSKGNIAYYAPMLVIDVYEHAYFLQYGDNKNEYIRRFMQNINWSIVDRRLQI